MSKLLCPECRHENEPERIYCHDCGARLNRSPLGKEKAGAPETPAETQKRLRRMLNPQGAKFRHGLSQVGKLILGAFAVATLIQIILPPDLPPAPKVAELGPQIGLDVETAVMNQRGAQLSYSEDQVNRYLESMVKRKKKDLDKPLLEFKRACAGFDEGTFRLTTERSLLGYSLYTGASYRVTVQDGKLAAVSRGGNLGRLPIHPALMKYADVILSDVWKALDHDRKQVARLAAIEFHPQMVVLTAGTR